MKSTGLFFGSFNPIHIGHLIIGNHIVQFSDLDQVWFVVSPQNPFKEKSSLLNQYERLNMVHIATEENDALEPSDIEFKLPQPSYTIDTLTYLKEKYPDRNFTLIMGQDNLASFHKWKNYEMILEDYKILVYRRAGAVKTSLEEHKSISFVDAPLLNISATAIRKMIKDGLDVKYLLSEPVYRFITAEGFYK